MGERNWTEELEGYLNDKFAKFCAATDRPASLSMPRISPALLGEESRYFLWGLDAGLFQIDDEGNVESDLVFSETNSNATAGKRWPLFPAHPPLRFLRESICQLATVSNLILKRGWLKSHVFMEPMIDEYRSLGGGGDILIKSPAGELWVSAKIKRNPPELEKLVTDLRTCGSRGAHTRDDCGFPQNHPTYEFCSRHRPALFWGVAPGADKCFQMEYDGNVIQMRQLVSLPPRSVIELNSVTS